MPVDKKPNAEPIRGYRLIEPLGTGGFGEVWKCEAPGGIFKAIKFVYGNLNSVDGNSVRAEEELTAVQRIKSIRHPFLLSIDRVEQVAGELIIVTELADQNLHELLTNYQISGKIGVPRQELLFYLREAAEVLDMLNHQFDLQHLDIKPRNLFLLSNHVKVADFGLVQSLGSAGKSKIQMGAITPLYAAPELFQGQLSRHCDQYSLAIVFQELLTGHLPFQGKNTRQLLLDHTQHDPDLEPLPEGDRAVVARAMAKNPDHRFGSCLEFVQHLQHDGKTPYRPASYFELDLADQAASADTLSNVAGDTEKLRSGKRPNLPGEVLAGYRWLETISTSPLGETWKVQAGEGKFRQAQILYGLNVSDKSKLQELVVRLRSLTHPGLFPSEIVYFEPGRLVTTSRLVKETLRDRFSACQSRKQAGLPRRELLDYLRAAAETLDYLFQQHSVQHLGLSPKTIVIDHGWLQIVEFGYAQLVWHPGQDIAQRNARYAAPELFLGQIARTSDQYSLALIYAEMLTGVHPFQGQAPRNRSKPNLDALPPADRETILRALDPEPSQRWHSSVEFFQALEGSHPVLQQKVKEQEDHFLQLLRKHRDDRVHVPPGTIVDDLPQLLHDLVTHAGGRPQSAPVEQGYILLPDQMMTHGFQAGLPLGSALQRLEELAQILGAQVLQQTESLCLMSWPLTATLWQAWRNKKPHVEIQVQLSRVHTMAPTPIDIQTLLRPVGCNAQQTKEVLEQRGPALLDQIRKQLLVNSEKRLQDRLLWPQTLQITPLYPDGTSDEAIECRGKDISYSGMGLYLPHELDTASVLLHLPHPLHPPTIAVPATLVRALRCADGWYEVGAMFCLPQVRKSTPELVLPG